MPLLCHVAMGLPLVLCLALPNPARAAQAPLLSDYTHTAWSGLQRGPGGVLRIAQTTDGWLWMSTEAGLYRYDGVEFERTDTVYRRPLASSSVMGMLAGRDGALWVGYRFGGVSVFRKDGARTYLETDGVPLGAVFDIAQAPDGTVWVAARDGVAILRPGATRFEPAGSAVGLPTRRIFQMLFARDGTQWVACLDGAFFRRPGARRFAQAWPHTAVQAMTEGPDGTVWASDRAKRYYRLDTRTAAPQPAPAPVLKAAAIGFDRAGQAWVMRHDAVERMGDPRAPSVPAQRLTLATGLSGALPQAFFQDREGTLWIGTSAGIDRLRRNRLKLLPAGGGFDHPAIIAGPDGSVWIGGQTGAVRSFDADGLRNTVARGHVTASHRAPDGAVWLADDVGLRRHARDGAVTHVAPPVTARGFDAQALHEDGQGGLWASFSGAGLYRLAQGRWTRDGGLAGLPRWMAMAMAVDAGGTLWMGHTRNMISLVTRGARGETVRRLDGADGLRVGIVMQVVRDGAAMWVGGEKGAMLYRGGSFLALRGRGGETFRGISGIVRLPNGELWMHGADGIYRIAAANLTAWLRDPAQQVDFERFDALDGLRGNAPQLRPLPSLIRAADGMLWFSTGSGVATIDPAAIRRNALAPPVQVCYVISEDVVYDTHDRAALALPQGATSLRVRYAGLSLAMPERVRFRYRLEGVDRGWQEAGSRRAAGYTNLAPGTYRFQVTAANEDGVWNPDGAVLDIRIPPTFVQTVWFELLLALGALALLYAAYALRLRYLTRRMQDQLRTQLQERSRIARSLHDTLLQSVQGLLMSFDGQARRLPEGSRERARMERGVGLARRLLVEGRNQIMGLRVLGAPDDMHRALRSFGAELAEQGGHAFDLRIVGRPQPLAPAVNDELYAIGREALFNASRYAQAARVVLTLEYGADLFTLRIRDDGRGLDAAVAASGHRPGHWGLPDMRARADALGARFVLASGPGEGTDIVVTLCGRQAYQFGAGSAGGWLARWRGRHTRL